MFSPCLQQVRASKEGGGTFRNSRPKTGKAISLFRAEISFSTLPVLLLPVRAVTEDMLNPRNTRNTRASLGRVWAGRLLPSGGRIPLAAGAFSCKFKTK